MQGQLVVIDSVNSSGAFSPRSAGLNGQYSLIESFRPTSAGLNGQYSLIERF